MDLTFVLPGLVLVAALFVFLPVSATVFRHFLSGKQVTCPVTHRDAAVSVAAGRAAVGAVLGHEMLRIEGCSLWGDDRHCAEACRPALMSAPDAGHGTGPLGPSVTPYTGGRGSGDGGGSSWHPFVYC